MATLNSTTINLVRRTALELLIRGVTKNDDELILFFWDLQYLYKFGLPEIVPPEIPVDFNDPQPDPSPIERLQVNESILSQLIDVVAGDPSPQPSLQSVLKDTNIRLSSAKKFAENLNNSLKMVNLEIEELEKRCI